MITIQWNGAGFARSVRQTIGSVIFYIINQRYISTFML